MKKTLIFIILVTLVFIGMQSCICDEEPANATLPQGIQMGFTIHVGGNKSASRGVPTEGGESVEAGTGKENEIDIANRDFRVYFFEANNDNTYIGELEVISVLDVTDNSNDGYNNDYYVVGQVTTEVATEMNNGFRMVVMANLGKWYKFNGHDNNIGKDLAIYGGYPQEDTDKDGIIDVRIGINGVQGNINRDGEGNGDGVYFYGKKAGEEFQWYEDFDLGFNVHTDADDRLIPMWGIRTYTGVKLEKNTITNVDNPLNMLRTMAKIEVIFDDKIELPTKDNNNDIDIYLKNFKAMAMIEPYNLEANNTNSYQSHGYNTYEDFELANTYYGITEGKIRLKLTNENNDNTRKYVIYVPEMDERNWGDFNQNNENSPQIQIRYGSKPENYTFPLKQPNGDGTFTTVPILRNHIYRYKIEKVNLNPVIKYEVVNWDNHKIIINYE